MENSDLIFVSTALKAVGFVCLAATSCFWISSCQLDQETIEICESSCQANGSHMVSVTSRECECSNKENAWIFPNN